MTGCFFVFAGSNATAAIPQTKYVILSASEISHRTIALIVVIARHEVPRQSVGIKYGVYAANFTQGDRHANCYSALNACALKLSFFAFFVKNASAL